MNLARVSHFSLKVEDGKNPQPLLMHYTSTEVSSLTCLTADCQSKFRVTVVLYLRFQSV